MRKLLLILLSLLLISGCSDKPNEADNVDEDTLSFVIWDIAPLYTFDNIDVDYTISDCIEYNSSFTYNMGSLYGYLDIGGITIINNNNFGFMNNDGEIKTDITCLGLGKLNSNTFSIQVDKYNSGYLNSDYSISDVNLGNFMDIEEYYPSFYWNDNGYVDMIDDNVVTSLEANELYNLYNNDNDFFVFTSNVEYTSGANLIKKDCHC